jgi:FkbM family methyltransferase
MLVSRRRAVVSLVNRVPARFAAPFRSGTALARIVAPGLERVLPREATEIVVRSGAAEGVRLVIDAQREKFYWTGAYELPVQRLLQRVLAPGACFWDVGAHIGFFALIASRFVGATGHVEAFEPLPENRNRLGSALELNDVANVRVHPVALGARAGSAPFVSSGSSLTGSLAGRDDEPGRKVQCRTLDQEADRLPLPDLIKIDVEGFELEALRGGARLLQEHRPRLVVEFSTRARLEDARSLLPRYGFTPLDDEHWLLEPRR